MTPDPRWLEILKASGGQAASLAIACGALLLFAWLGWIPELHAAVTIAAVFGFVLGSMLALVSFVSAFLKSIPLHKWAVRSFHERRAARDHEKYLEYLTDQERKIIAYLLFYNQKMFTAEADGGYAVTLISRGIIVRAMNPGQEASADDVPFCVPDHVWKVLQEHKDKFPHKLPPKGDVDAYPWRIPWQLR